MQPNPSESPVDRSPHRSAPIQQRFPTWNGFGTLTPSYWQRIFFVLQKQSSSQLQRRHLIVFLLIGSTTLAVSTAIYTSYAFIRGLILDNLKEIALLKIQRSTDEVDYWLSNRKAEIETLAHTPTVRSFNWSVVKPRLQLEMERLQKNFFLLSVAQSDGQNRTISERRSNVKDRKYFQIAMTGQINISDPLISRTTKVPTVVVAAPVRVLPHISGEVKAVLIAFMGVNRVAEVVNKLQYGEGSYAFALNSEGVPIVHPQSDLVGNLDRPAPSLLQSPQSELATVARNMVDGKTQIDLTKIDGKWVYVAYHSLKEVKWSMALVIPRENIESKLWLLNLLASVVGGLLFVTLLATLWLVYSSEKNRINASREAMLNRITERIRASLNLDKILQTTVEELAKFLQIERVAFSWYSTSEQTLEILWEYSTRGTLKQLGQFDVSSQEDFPTQLERKKSIVLPCHTFCSSEDRQLELKENCYLAIPVQTQNEPRAYLICYQSTPWFWSREEKELLQAVADQLTIAITQSDLYTQTQEQVKLLNNTLSELKRTQMHLVQSEKMSSLGQMVAGIAHEINNPVNFIFGNLPHTRDYVEDLLKLVSLYKQHIPHLPAEIQEFEDDIDLEFLQQDLLQILSSMKIGTDRIRDLVLSLRNFSRLDEMDKKEVNIEEGINNTLLLLSNRTKNHIAIVKHYESLPLVECYPAQLNQVFMNLLSNAIDALMETQISEKIIAISTSLFDKEGNPWVRVTIADNGPGVPDSIQSQIFNPFFTTKPIGKGTGLGLAISYQIVTEGHGGQLRISTPPTGGTEFMVEIPMHALESKTSSPLLSNSTVKATLA